MLLETLPNSHTTNLLNARFQADRAHRDDLEKAAATLKARFPAEGVIIDTLMAGLRKGHLTSAARTGWGPLALYGYVGQPIGPAVERAQALAEALDRPLVDVDLACMQSEEIEAFADQVKRIGPMRPVLVYHGLDKADEQTLRALAGVAASEAWNGVIAIVVTAALHSQVPAQDQASGKFQGNVRVLLANAGMPLVVVTALDLVFAFQG